MGSWRHVRGFLAFPFMGIVLVPSILLLLGSGTDLGWGLNAPWYHLAILAGLALIGVGLYLVLEPTLLFAWFGGGTVAHFDPPERFVVRGSYRHVRNPLVLGVIVTVTGEGVLLGAMALLVMAVLLFPINHLVFVLEEEPRLLRRFGDDYRRYLDNVPRWLPRMEPWDIPDVPLETMTIEGDGNGCT